MMVGSFIQLSDSICEFSFLQVLLIRSSCLIRYSLPRVIIVIATVSLHSCRVVHFFVSLVFPMLSMRMTQLEL